MLIGVEKLCNAQQWQPGHATFYNEAPGGACGFGTGEAQGLYKQKLTTALNGPLFEKGATCGSCWLVKCVDNQWCLPNAPTIKVVATDLCPPGGNGVCNPQYKHFDMSIPAFTKIAVYKGGYIAIQYARTKCDVQGGMRFTISGNPTFFLVLVWNVGGDGQVVGMSVKTPQSQWQPMSRNWGQNWQLNVKNGLQGNSLSFQVRTSDGKSVVSNNVAPGNWQFGQTYTGINF
ncbi:hypothetical protein SUGI_0006290 [Cryptomeria japonica]|uniref:expansin-A9-like n=1 Tax=Cryptomeria japonica TaxID=3369 RepID=UPI002408CA31|nr:expansin-A9-like [Cryptomeria japonica]GLJ04913.1 hypothetical protein SUGI_0006290 [Cryptomeria japonica]